MEAGKLLVEAGASSSLKFLPAELAQEDSSAAAAAPVWGCYPDVPSLTALADYLNAQGAALDLRGSRVGGRLRGEMRAGAA